MVSRTRRRHGGGVQLTVSALTLLLASRACNGRAADSASYQGEHAAAAAASAAVAPHDVVQGSSRAAVGAGVFDASFDQLRPETPLPDMVQAAAAQHDGDKVQPQLLSPPPSALSLRECSLGDAGVPEVARSPWVCGETAVRSLSLRQNQVTAVGARALLDALRASGPRDRLSSLELDFNPLGDAGVQPLPAYLKERAARGGGGLEELSLRFCDIGPAGCRSISSALLKSAAAAKAADAAGVAAPIDNGDAPSLPDSIASGAERDPPSEAAKEAGGDGRGVVPSVPPPASGVRRLLLAGNQRLGAAGARALASALKKDRSLQVLDLTRCKIGDEGARCLADALRSNSSLRELRLGYNDISADGASALASLLHAGSSALDSLELQGNRVGDAGATALANGLAGGGKRGRRDAEPGSAVGLRSLNLAGNGIGCAGGVALAKALSGGRSGGGGGCALEELELAGNALTLSAFQAAEDKKNSSLYKSAGGALSSLLNTFVDESYYSGGGPSSQDGGGGGGGGGVSSPLGNSAVAPRRCSVAELANALAGGGGGRSGGRGGNRPPLIKALGLGKTGLTDKDASRLAATLRARPLDSPLEEVEVGMNMLSPKALEAVREAVESPTGPEAGDFTTGGERGRRRQPQQQQQQQQRRQQQRRQQRRQQQSGGRDVTGPNDSCAAGRPQSKPRRRGGRARAGAGGASDERAARGEVGEYVPPGGSVELGMFGRKLVSFGQERGDARELNVEVFGKRVRFERPSATSTRSRSRSRARAQSSPPPPPPSPMGGESDFEPWSEDGEVELDFGEVSEAAATHGSDHSSSAWSSDEEGEEDGWSDEDKSDSDSDDDGGAGTGGGGNNGFVGGTENRRSSGGRGGPSHAMEVRGGGGGGREHPAGRRMGRQRRRSGDGQDSDDGEWAAGFEPTTCEDEDGGGGAAPADKIEWEAGFDEQGRREQHRQDGPSARGSCYGERSAGSEPSVSPEPGCEDDEFAGGGAGRTASAKIGMEKRAAGVVEGLQSGTGDAEWSAGFGSVEGGGGGATAAAADEMEWDAGFDNTDLGSGFGTERDGGGGGRPSSL